MPYQISTFWQRFSILTIAILLSACAGTPQQQVKFEPPVYPPAPAEPRFIFERTLRYNTNVEPLTRAKKLRRYATGQTDDIKGLVKPFGVAASKGRVYVTDTVQRAVLLFDITGSSYKEFGREKPGKLLKPLGIDISSLDEVLVADVSAQRVAIFDLEGQFKQFIGSSKIFKRPSGVSASPDGSKIYVIDTGGVDNQDHFLHILDRESGDLIESIGGRGNQTGQFNLPLQVTTANDGTIYVVDKGNFRIQAFSPDGTFKHSFGSLGRYPGQFFSPKGISTDPDGNIYVVDTAFGNTQIFNPEGQLLMVIGQRKQSSAPGNYMLPAGIDVDETGRVYIADQFFRKVDVFRPIDLKASSEETARASE